VEVRESGRLRQPLVCVDVVRHLERRSRSGALFVLPWLRTAPPVLCKSAPLPAAASTHCASARARW
jgi:hypothetical protein